MVHEHEGPFQQMFRRSLISVYIEAINANIGSGDAVKVRAFGECDTFIGRAVDVRVRIPDSEELYMHPFIGSSNKVQGGNAEMVDERDDKIEVVYVKIQLFMDPQKRSEESCER